MNKTEKWLLEEKQAKIIGWDFSHIEGKCIESEVQWDYKNIIKKYLNDKLRLLDIDTGGGEFLLSLQHPFEMTGATEGYQPNVKLCSEKLIPLGIDFKPCDNVSKLPFEDESYDIVINRHGSVDEGELNRILKSGGLFITEQVGAENDRELVDLLTPGVPIPFPKQYLSISCENLRKNGFKIIESNEAFGTISFNDVGALIWFAKIIEWEFIGFDVKNHYDNICKAERIIEENGIVSGRTHRYMIVAEKS